MGDSATVVACISHTFKGVVHYLLVSRSCAKPWEMISGRVREREIDEDAMIRVLADAVNFWMNFSNDVVYGDAEGSGKMGSTPIISVDDLMPRICSFFHIPIGPIKAFEVNICGQYKGFMWMNVNQLGILVREDPGKLDLAAAHIAKLIVCGEFGKNASKKDTS